MEEKLITVAALPYSSAHILEGRLEAEGIECYLKNINLVQSTVGDGVRLVVREKDAERALGYLSEMQRVELEEKLKSVKIKPIRKILVPVDFSVASLNACFYCLNLAAKLGADIRLLNAYNIPEIRPMPFDESDFYQGTLTVHLRELKKQAEHDMREFIAKLKLRCEQSGITGVGIEKILVTGYPAEAILQVVESMRTDLVVMGLESVKTYTFAPVGDIVAKVVSALKVPTLVIPSNYTYSGGLSTVNRVLFATDFEEADYYSVLKLMNIVAPFNVEIHCVHIGAESVLPWDKIRMDELQQYIVRGFGKVKVQSAILEAENVSDGLNGYIDENQIELMAVTTRDRSLFSRIISPSVTRKVLVHSSVPMLVFHGGRRQ